MPNVDALHYRIIYFIRLSVDYSVVYYLVNSKKAQLTVYTNKIEQHFNTDFDTFNFVLYLFYNCSKLEVLS